MTFYAGKTAERAQVSFHMDAYTVWKWAKCLTSDVRLSATQLPGLRRVGPVEYSTTESGVFNEPRV